MYTSLPWAEDITRVYKFQRSSEGIFLCAFQKKKKVIFGAAQGWFVYIPSPPTPTYACMGLYMHCGRGS